MQELFDKGLEDTREEAAICQLTDDELTAITTVIKASQDDQLLINMNLTQTAEGESRLHGAFVNTIKYIVRYFLFFECADLRESESFISTMALAESLSNKNWDLARTLLVISSTGMGATDWVKFAIEIAKQGDLIIDPYDIVVRSNECFGAYDNIFMLRGQPYARRNTLVSEDWNLDMDQKIKQNKKASS